MSKTKIELNGDYVREVLLKGPEMQSICKELAEGMASRYGKGAKVSVHVGPNRCNASVYASTDNNDLLKAMGD